MRDLTLKSATLEQVFLQLTGTGAARMILAVAKNRLMNLRRDRAAFVLAFVLPVAFFSIFAGIFSGSSRSATRKIAVIVVDEDGSEGSRRFVAGLKREAGLSIGMKTGRRRRIRRGPLYTAALGRAGRAQGRRPGRADHPEGLRRAADRVRPVSADRSGCSSSSDSADPDRAAGRRRPRSRRSR